MTAIPALVAAAVDAEDDDRRTQRATSIHGATDPELHRSHAGLLRTAGQGRTAADESSEIERPQRRGIPQLERRPQTANDDLIRPDSERFLTSTGRPINT